MQCVVLPGETPQAEEAWDICRRRSFDTAEGRRCNISRFLGFSAANRKRRPFFWNTDLWERELLCLEEDMMGSNTCVDKALFETTEQDEVGEKSGPVGGPKPCILDRSVRSCCQNTCVVSRMFLAGQTNFRLSGHLSECSELVATWYAQGNATTRSVEAAQGWLVGEATGKYMGQCWAFLGKLEDEGALSNCCFAVTHRDAGMLGSDIITEDEMADHMCIYAYTLFGLRAKTHLPLLIWIPTFRSCAATRWT